MADVGKQWTKHEERGDQDWRSRERMMSWKNTENQPKMMSLRIMNKSTINTMM